MIDERRYDLNEHPASLLQPSPAFRHADWCHSQVSAPLCGCKHRRARPAALGACLALLLAVDPAHACTPRDSPPERPKVEKPERDTGGDHNWWEEPRRSQQIRGGPDGC